MNGYIIEKYNDMNNAYTSRRLAEEAKRLGIALDIIGVCDTYEYNGVLYNKSSRIMERDFSIIRFKEGNINNKLSSVSLKQYNSIENIKLYGDKSIQLTNIVSKQMQLPKYILSSLDVKITDIIELIGLPFVVKSLRGSQGDEVYLISSLDEYNKLRRVYKGVYKEFVFEEFIKESSGKDIRVFSIMGEAAACMKRTSKDGFKANFALGACVEAYPIDDDIKEIAKDIYKATSLAYAGIDLLLGRDGYVFCEVNVTPGIEGIEKASGINIAGNLISYIKKDVINNTLNMLHEEK